MSHFNNQKWDKTIESVIYTVIWKGIVVGMVDRTANIEFQLSELFAYPNNEIFGAGQRGSDNRGWTVVAIYFLKDAIYPQ